MKSLLLASALLSLIGGQALAADAISAEPATAHDWSGVYVGGQIGYGFGRTDATYNLPNTPTIRGSQNYDTDGFLGGDRSMGDSHWANGFHLGRSAKW